MLKKENYIPRRFGKFFVLVNIETNEIFKINELLYDLIHIKNEPVDSPKRVITLQKHNISEVEYIEKISMIAGVINAN